MYIHRICDADTPVSVDPATLVEDPHASFRALRQKHPVIQLGEGQYMALRARDVLAMLIDLRAKQIEAPDYLAINDVPDGAVARFLSDIFLFDNGAAHRDKRALFAPAFARNAMQPARPRIRAAAERIIREAPRGETFDFVAEVAGRLPAELIAVILGLPVSEASYFAPRVYKLAQALTPVYPHALHLDIDRAAAELFCYVEGHMRARLDAPRDDLLSNLIAGWRVDQILAFDSLVHQVIGILLAGSDTTRAAFAMLVALLLRHPGQWAAVKADPTLIPGAVSEAMRYEPSVGSIPRFTAAPVDIGGVALPAGVMLRVSTMSAMRDPAYCAYPDRFDIRREDNPRLHLVFGGGAHRCIGEALARLEMAEGLAALIAAAPDIEVETAPRMLGFGGIRQITPMRVRVR